MKTTVKTTIMLLCLMSLSAFTSCGPKSRWEQVSKNAIRCVSNESNKTMLVLTIPSNGNIGAEIEDVAIVVDGYQKSLPDIIKFDASFEKEVPGSSKEHTFRVINFNYYSPENKSIDGYYGVADEMGGLVITMTNERLENALLNHQYDKNGCIITSSSFTQSYTFRIKNLGKTLIGITSRNAGW